MPIILTGLGLAGAILGAGGHLSAKETNEQAQKISQEAQELYDDAKNLLEMAQNETEISLLKLGYEKKDILDTSMKQFLDTYSKLRNVHLKESIGLNEISKFTLDQGDVIKIREMTDIYSSAIQSGATGAAAGAIVALAVSGSLPVVTGGLATAGTALAAGELSAAAGIAGSALSFGAAMTPLTTIAAPVVLFTGISASIKADENLEKAQTMQAEAEKASAEMAISRVLCQAITDRSNMFSDLLMNLNQMFSECVALSAGVVRKKEGKFLKKKQQLSTDDFTREELDLLSATRALAGAVKTVIDTPILSEDGHVSEESKKICDNEDNLKNEFAQKINKVKQIDYGVKPIELKSVQKSSSETTVLKGSRNILSVVSGVILASIFAGNITYKITDAADKFLFLDSYTANKIAIWLFICASVIMVIGKFKGSKTEKACDVASGIATVVLYVQYCRSVEQMKHYIIFSLVWLIVSATIFGLFDNNKNQWQFGNFLTAEIYSMVAWSLLFLIYVFFAKFVGISNNICLIVTSVLLVVSLISIYNPDEKNNS